MSKLKQFLKTPILGGFLFSGALNRSEKSKENHDALWLQLSLRKNEKMHGDWSSLIPQFLKIRRNEGVKDVISKNFNFLLNPTKNMNPQDFNFAMSKIVIFIIWRKIAILGEVRSTFIPWLVICIIYSLEFNSKTNLSLKMRYFSHMYVHSWTLFFSDLYAYLDIES